ncbi:MAG: GNAT family N-acetyltransferase [Pseudomonadota bacterium]
MTTAPRLETDHLVLREPELRDWPDFAELMASERSTYMGGPFSVRDAWGIFCTGIAQWRLYSLGILSIELRETGHYLGQIEINQGPLFPEKELGWQLSHNAEGKGYAFEAAVALRDWAFKEQGLETLVSYIDPHNTRSIQLAKRLGATLDEEAEKQDPDDLVYRHVRGTF